MGRLFLVSTPIGNLEDITVRAVKTLLSVDRIACEDTRKAGLLVAELKKRYPFVTVADEKPQSFIRFDDHTEQQHTPEIIELLKVGKDIALISDAGTPLISDPGYRLVTACQSRGFCVIPVPGPTAFVAALTASGLPADKFMFLGYPPEKDAHRKKLFENLAHMTRIISTTYIFYCAPHKLDHILEELHDFFGDISISVARELTKQHEEIWTGTLASARARLSEFRGELVVLLNLTPKKS